MEVVVEVQTAALKQRAKLDIEAVAPDLEMAAEVVVRHTEVQTEPCLELRNLQHLVQITPVAVAVAVFTQQVVVEVVSLYFDM
jgi:hypothetical protein